MKYAERLEQMNEMITAVNDEFFDKDGSHYGEDPSDWNSHTWLRWLQIANEALDCRWTQRNMEFASYWLEEM